ncbi:MAG: SRPBCC family protein [Deltaproteobacteria bacterium]
MAIDIKETFEVDAPIEDVWSFIMDPRRVAPCMPGAQLDEVVDERTFLGSIKIKVGAITASYKGRVEMTSIDEATHSVEMAAEGRETSGGTARGTMISRLRSLDGGATEMVIEANVDLTGRIMQVGRGMIQGVSHQLFLQFVAAAKKHLEAAAAASAVEAGATGSEVAPSSGQAIRVVPLILNVIWAAIVGFFRRLSGRS